MNLQAPGICIVLLGLCACSGDTASGPGEEALPVLRATPSNEEIVQKVYDSGYTVPANFYVDERATTTQTYSLYHVKDASVSYELCTDDAEEARAWEDADNQSRSVSGYYVGSRESGNYFEFIRELSYPDGVGNTGGDTSPGFARVFKCSRINRNGVDRNLRNGFAGVLNMRPLSAEIVREMTEYLWQFVFFESSARKVLQSYSTVKPDVIEHTLVLAIAVNQGAGRCDRIEVIDWTFSADKSSGELSKSFNFLFALEAQVIGGVPQLCP